MLGKIGRLRFFRILYVGRVGQGGCCVGTEEEEEEEGNVSRSLEEEEGEGEGLITSPGKRRIRGFDKCVITSKANKEFQQLKYFYFHVKLVLKTRRIPLFSHRWLVPRIGLPPDCNL